MYIKYFDKNGLKLYTITTRSGKKRIVNERELTLYSTITSNHDYKLSDICNHFKLTASQVNRILKKFDISVRPKITIEYKGGD